MGMNVITMLCIIIYNNVITLKTQNKLYILIILGCEQNR